MRVCPTCGARYEAPAQYCQRDGVPLRIEQESRDPYLGTKILGQFRLEKVIGSGGMGIVYAGWDEGLGRRVAVKILHRDLVTNRDVVARFHREAQIAHQLDHPNIVRLILFGQLSDGNLYLVLEYLEGPTLLQALDRDGPMPALRAVKIAAGVSDAIGYAHRRDIIHRDMKPENIMLVNRDGDADHPKVLDFGIAKMLIGGDTLVTQAGLIFGTARYISPEGAQGDPVDKRSDVYSLGIIAYQLLTGVTPFDSQEPVQLLLKHIHEQPVPLRSHAAARDVPPALEAVVMRALAKGAAARYGDGSSFARALREALAESDPNAQIRSVVPTASMPMYLAPPSAVLAPPNGAYAQAAQQAPHGHAGNGGGANVSASAAPHSTMLAGSPAHAQEPSYAGAVPPAASSGPYPAMYGANAIAMPAVPRVAPTMAVPAYVPTASAPAEEPDPPRSRGYMNNNAFDHSSTPDLPSASSAYSPVSTISPRDSDDDFSIPGLPRNKLRARKAGSSAGGSSRTWVTVAASVLATLVIGATAAWALGLYPSQRREVEVRGLLYRAEDALRSEHYLHTADENDVEDLTDAVLALDSSNVRARQIRGAGAVSLRNRAVELRNGGHADQALPLLRSATRLVDDPEIRSLIATIEQEAQSPTPTEIAPVPTAPTNAHPNNAHPHHPSEAAPPSTPAQPVQTTPVGPTFSPAVTSHPTFTPGRDPNQPPAVTRPANNTNVRPPTPVVVPDPPQMQGGPSAPDNPPPPNPDPTNGGGVAF